jgi:hypothetical protein
MQRLFLAYKINLREEAQISQCLVVVRIVRGGYKVATTTDFRMLYSHAPGATKKINRS